MSNDVARRRTVVELDGFNDFTNEIEGEEDRASGRIIQGGKLKYIDPRWLLKSTTDVTGKLVTAIGVLNVVNKWSHDNMPLETRVLAPGEKFPNFTKLNDECDRSEWREAFGKLAGPWSGQHAVYFIDEVINRYTWPSPTSTVGSSICVSDLVDQIRLVRKFRGAHVFPVVELSNTDFRTGYGLRKRPHLAIKRWVTLGPDRAGDLLAPHTPALSGATPKTGGAPADAPSVSPVTLSEEMGGDKISY